MADEALKRSGIKIQPIQPNVSPVPKVGHILPVITKPKKIPVKPTPKNRRSWLTKAS